MMYCRKKAKKAVRVYEITIEYMSGRQIHENNDKVY